MATAICERLELAIKSRDLSMIDECLHEISPKTNLDTFKANFKAVYKKLTSLELKYEIQPDKIGLSDDMSVQQREKIEDSENIVSCSASNNITYQDFSRDIKHSILAAYYKLFQMMNGVRTILKDYVDVCQKLVNYNYKLESIRNGVLKNVVTFVNHMVKKDYTIEAKEFMYSANLIIDLAYRLSIDKSAEARCKGQYLPESLCKKDAVERNPQQNGPQIPYPNLGASDLHDNLIKTLNNSCSVENLATRDYITLTVEILPLLDCIKHMISFSKTYPSKISTIKYFLLLCRLAYTQLDFTMYLNCIYRILTIDKGLKVGYENLKFFRDVSDFFTTNGDSFGNLKVYSAQDAYLEIVRLKKESGRELTTSNDDSSKEDSELEKTMGSHNLEIIRYLYQKRTPEPAIVSIMQDGRVEQKSFDCTIPFSFNIYRFLKINGFDFEITNKRVMQKSSDSLTQISVQDIHSSQNSTNQADSSCKTTDFCLHVRKHGSISYHTLVFEIKQKCEMRQTKNIEKMKTEAKSVVAKTNEEKKIPLKNVKETQKPASKPLKIKRKRPVLLDNFKTKYLRSRVISDKTLKGCTKTIKDKIREHLLGLMQDVHGETEKILSSEILNAQDFPLNDHKRDLNLNTRFLNGLFVLIQNSLEFVLSNLDSINSEEDVDDIITQTHFSRENLPTIFISLLIRCDFKETLQSMRDVYVLCNENLNVFIFALLALFKEFPEYIDTFSPYLRPENVKNLTTIIDKTHKAYKNILFTTIDEQKIDRTAVNDFLNVIVEQITFYVQYISSNITSNLDACHHEQNQKFEPLQDFSLDSLRLNLENKALQIFDHLFHAREKSRASLYNRQACEISARKTILHEFKESITTNLFELEEKILTYRSQRNHGDSVLFSKDMAPRSQHSDDLKSKNTFIDGDANHKNIFERGSSLHAAPAPLKAVGDFDSEKSRHSRISQRVPKTINIGDNRFKEPHNSHRNVHGDSFALLEEGFRGSSSTKSHLKNQNAYDNGRDHKLLLDNLSCDNVNRQPIKDAQTDALSLLEGFKRGSEAESRSPYLQRTDTKVALTISKKSPIELSNFEKRHERSKTSDISSFEHQTAIFSKDFRGSSHSYEQTPPSRKNITKKPFDSTRVMEEFRGSEMPFCGVLNDKEKVKCSIISTYDERRYTNLHNRSSNTSANKNGIASFTRQSNKQNITALETNSLSSNFEGYKQPESSKVEHRNLTETKVMTDFRGSSVRGFQARNQRTKNDRSHVSQSHIQDKNAVHEGVYDVYAQKQAAIAREMVNLSSNSTLEQPRRKFKDLSVSLTVDRKFDNGGFSQKLNSRNQSSSAENSLKNKLGEREIDYSLSNSRMQATFTDQRSSSGLRSNSSNQKNDSAYISTGSKISYLNKNDEFKTSRFQERKDDRHNSKNSISKKFVAEDASLTAEKKTKAAQDVTRNGDIHAQNSNNEERVENLESFSRGSRLHK